MFDIRKIIQFLLAKKQIKFAKIYPKESDNPIVKITTF